MNAAEKEVEFYKGRCEVLIERCVESEFKLEGARDLIALLKTRLNKTQDAEYLLFLETHINTLADYAAELEEQLAAMASPY